MEATLNVREKADIPNPERIASRLLESLVELSQECKARLSKRHLVAMPDADLSGFKLGITWLDQQRQRESLLTLGRAFVREAPNLVGGHGSKLVTLEQIRTCLTPILKMLPDVHRPPEMQLEWLFECLLMDELQCLPEKEVDAILQRRSYRSDHWQYIAHQLERNLPKVTRTGLSWQGQTRRRHLLEHLCFAYRKSGWGERIIPLLKKELSVCLCYGELAEELNCGGELEQAQTVLLNGIKKYHAARPALADEWLEKLNSLS